MLKRFTSGILIVAALVTNVHVTFGANDLAQLAESDEEISRAATQLNTIIAASKQQQLKEMNTIDLEHLGNLKVTDALKMIAAKKDVLQNVNGYKDLQTTGTLDDTVKMLRDKKYPIDESALALYREIYTYKETKKVSDPVAVLQYFNAQAGLKEKPKTGIPEISFVKTAKAYSISYDSWRKLTTAEKLLIVTDPKAALITDSLAKLAFQWTQEKFRKNGLGDQSDGYRHGIWNALMTRDISRSWAEAYATAHEDKSQTELQQKEADGYYKYQHRNMDLNNNKVGRDQIQWYEYWFNCSDATVKTRISNKLTNKSGGIIWLHS